MNAYANGASDYVRDHSRWIVEIPVRIVAIIVVTLIVRFLIHRFVDRLLRPVGGGGVPKILQPFKERAENSALLRETGLLSQRRAQRAATIASILKSIVSFTLLLIAVLLILNELEVSLAPFIAGTSVVGVALGFGAQNIVKDFLGGMFIMLEDQYGVGDVISIDQTSGINPTVGTVEGVGLRSTRLRGEDGVVFYLRNGEIIKIANTSQ